MKKFGIVFVALALVLSLSLAGCAAVTAFIDALYAIDGKVVNVKAKVADPYYKSSKSGSTATLVGATVTFKNNKTGNTYSGVVGSSGTYYISNVPNGTYTISATDPNNAWAFIPATDFEVTASTLTAPNLLAFPKGEAGALTVVMTWTNTSVDMDLHMTQGVMTSGVTSTTHLWTSLDGGPASGTISGTNWSAALDRDVYGSYLTTTPLAETITLTATGGIIPGSSTAYNSAAATPVNDFRFYIHAWGNGSTAGGVSATGNSTQGPAVARVDVFNGSDHYGTFYAPYNTSERTLEMFRVQFDNSSSNNFAVYTETLSVPTGVFPSLQGAPVVGTAVTAYQ